MEQKNTKIFMPKVTVVQVIYNNRRFIEPVFNAVFNQTFKDIEVVAVIAGNEDGSKELLAEKFPQVKIIDPGYNIGFAKGHNLVFEKYDPEFFQLVNPDLVMEPNYIEEMLKAFDDEKVGAVTGKLLKCNFVGADPIRPDEGKIISSTTKVQKTNIIDSTGVVIYKSGAARDRGQHETDNGQYDDLAVVQAVSAAGAMYRRAALESTKLSKISTTPAANAATPPVKEEYSTLVEGGGIKYEYFDEDFHSYWEDVDLAWRMSNGGWKCMFQPAAIAHHGRGSGSHPGGYKKVFSYIKFHRQIPPRIRQLNYQNHIFMYLKNSSWFYPQFFIREFFMACYMLLFEISTFKVVPNMFKLFPKMWQKRKNILVCKNRGRDFYKQK